MADRVEIKTLEDIITNLDILKNKEIQYYCGTWCLEDDSFLLNDKLFNTLFLCNLIKKETTVISHHSFHLYRFNPLLYSLNLNEFKKEIIRLLFVLKENNRRFKSIKEIESILNNKDFSTAIWETFNNSTCYWSRCKYEKSFVIKSNKYLPFEYNFVYYAITENLKKKNNLYYSILRVINNLFYGFDYPRATWNSKYMEEIEDSNGKRFNQKLWHADYKNFEEKILKEINSMLTNGKGGNNGR